MWNVRRKWKVTRGETYDNERNEKYKEDNESRNNKHGSDLMNKE